MKFYKNLSNNKKYVPSIGLKVYKYNNISTKEKEKVNDIVLVEKNESNSDIKVKQEIKTKIRWADYCDTDSEMDFDSIPIIGMNDITIEDM
tara:strand:- start:781 stop:1053 length:273 start_codon:yes stop_codon:yes gene_type:complete